MNVDIQRTIDRLLGIPACALLSAIDSFRPRRPLGKPQSILVVLLSEAGSMICAQPMLRSLAARYPNAVVHVMVLARNRSFVELMGLVSPERVIVVDDTSLGSFIRGSLSAIRQMRAARVDTVIDCELFARVSAIFSYLSGARTRVGFHRHTQEGLYRGSFINRRVPYNPYAHIAIQFLGLVSAIDSNTTPANKEYPLPERPAILPIAFDPAELQGMSDRLHRDFPALRKRSLVLLYPSGGLLPVRAWPLSYFQRLAVSLIRDGHAVGVVGLEADREVGQSIVDHCDSTLCVNLTGYTTTIRDLVLLFHSSTLLISNDGGPVHFAALTPMPVLALFGPETPLLYGPLSPRARVMYRGLPCSPCLTAYNHRRTPCDGDNQCLKQVSVADVLEAARGLIREARAA
jgi:lipopolysaccharide heptosyltransferase II